MTAELPKMPKKKEDMKMIARKKELKLQAIYGKSKMSDELLSAPLYSHRQIPQRRTTTK